jgi:hypothetical protein
MDFRAMHTKICALFAAIVVSAVLGITTVHAEHVHESPAESAACVICHFHHNIFLDSSSDCSVEIELVLHETLETPPEYEVFIQNFLALSKKGRAPPIA